MNLEALKDWEYLAFCLTRATELLIEHVNHGWSAVQLEAPLKTVRDLTDLVEKYTI